MESKDNIVIHMNGGQLNLAKDEATINATQNNGIEAKELDDIIHGITENLSGLNKENADEIMDIVEMAKEELTKPEPKTSRLKNCLSLLTPLFSIVKGIPVLASNLQKLQNIISSYIK